MVGGTGQYVWGLLEGWQVPEVNPNAKLRETLELRLESEGVEALYEDLRRVDAEAAERVDGRNPRRVIRALEIAITRKDDAHSRGDDDERSRKITPDYDVMVVGLTMERSALYERIDARIDAQMAAGWLDEVRGLRELGFGLEHAALSGLGYGELMRYLDGEMALDDAVQRIKYRTHRYARQQYNVVSAGRRADTVAEGAGGGCGVCGGWWGMCGGGFKGTERVEGNDWIPGGCDTIVLKF